MRLTSMPISRRDFLKKSVQGALGLFGAAGLSGIYSHWIEPYWIEIKQVDVTLANLPSAFHQFRIVHFSDLHLGFNSKPEHLSELVGRVRQIKPDLICFTGDLVDRSVSVISEAVAALSQLQAPFGQYAVLGNHDAFGNRRAVTRGLSQAGFHVLHNKHAVVRKGKDKLYVAGVDDPWVGTPDIDAALLQIPENSCTILLAHEPDFADQYGRFPVDLQLSGHSHGGQICIPLIGALYTPPHGSKYTNGLYQIPNSRLQVYTTRGIGMTRIPLRFNCRPEFTVMTLKGQSLE
ncbi:twin-arginine translocation signal domain-containing protein [Paenibacillus sp. LMG 31460]|uniref:Twin-arginine translocation signal domain-containing protein n=1 Tax=Paenibacillus germinis TaxID=2654979 RepID=A0ABX1Z9H5_9BACL|nr:metallophosphoesterase [Paenibacillus germinis]NOU88553.1 twin-arginine translocation signal domain-containing protein [Paenibacillus germinis]